MQYYDLTTVIAGMPISLLCGVLASFIVSIFGILITSLPFCVRQAVSGKSDKHPKERLAEILKEDTSSPVTCFLGVITVFLVYILLSYVFLCGQIRLYIFLFMLAGFFLSRRFLTRYLEYGVRAALFFAILCVSKILFIFRKILIFILKMLKINRKVEKTIDNKAEIL